MRLWKRRGVSSRLRPPRVPRGVRGLQPHRGVVPSQHRSQNIAGSFWCPDKKPSSSRDIVMPGTAAAPHARRWRGFSFELSAQAATAVTSGPTKATRGPPGGANIFGAALRQQSPPGREAGTRRPAAEACRGEKPAPRGLSRRRAPCWASFWHPQLRRCVPSGCPLAFAKQVRRCEGWFLCVPHVFCTSPLQKQRRAVPCRPAGRPWGLPEVLRRPRGVGPAHKGGEDPAGN